MNKPQADSRFMSCSRVLYGCTTVLFLVVIGCAWLSFSEIAPWMDNTWELIDDHLPGAAEDTLSYFLETYPYLPQDVELTSNLETKGAEYGLEEYDVRSLIAAAHRNHILSEHLIALAIHTPAWRVGFPDSLPAALELGESFFQSGVYDQDNPEQILLVFNPDGGLEFVSAVLATSEDWHGPLAGVKIQPVEPVGLVSLSTVFVEMLRYRVLGFEAFAFTGDLPLVLDGTFVNPHPGSVRCGNPYGLKVGSGIHWGIDMCTGSSSPVVSAHNCVVTFVGFIDRRSAQAVSWWISGNTVACEGKLPDGSTVWSVYGHGRDGTTRVERGQTLRAGEPIFMSNCHKNDPRELCSGTHLHFGMKINGGWIDPNLLIP